MTGFEPTISWTQIKRLSQIRPHSNNADYCELAICKGGSFNFSLTVQFDIEIWHSDITVQNGLQQINLCTIGHTIDGVFCCNFRPRFYHIWAFKPPYNLKIRVFYGLIMHPVTICIISAVMSSGHFLLNDLLYTCAVRESNPYYLNHNQMSWPLNEQHRAAYRTWTGASGLEDQCTSQLY